MSKTYKEWLEDLHTLETEPEKIDFIKLTLKHKKRTHWFGRFIFPHIIQGNNDVPDCHIELIEALNERKDSAIVYPRGHAKSTWEKIDTLHDIVYGLEPVILYVGNTIKDASLHFESIKSELEGNEILRAIYGDLVPQGNKESRKWTNTHFETTNGVNLVARGSMKGRGINIKNQRPTKIILDDVEDDEQVRSVDRREKLTRWLKEVIIPSKDPHRGYIKFIGTVLSPNCEVLSFYRQHGGVFRKAIENGKPIWPHYFSMQKLTDLKASMGSRAFAQEMMNTPVNSETALIKPEWISYYRELDTDGMFKVIMFDPQAGQTKTADYYGLSILGFRQNEAKRYLIDVQSGRLSQLEQAALVVRTWQANENVVMVGVEKVMTQVAVYQLILDWKAGKIDFEDVDNNKRAIPILPVTPKGKDKVARLQQFEADFERGHIFLHESLEDFATRLSAFPDLDHDDDIDSFIYCLEKSFSKEHGSYYSRVQAIKPKVNANRPPEFKRKKMFKQGVNGF